MLKLCIGFNAQLVVQPTSTLGGHASELSDNVKEMSNKSWDITISEYFLLSYVDLNIYDMKITDQFAALAHYSNLSLCHLSQRRLSGNAWKD